MSHANDRLLGPAGIQGEPAVGLPVVPEVAAASESLEVTSPYSVNRIRCRADKSSGDPCQAYPTRSSEFCFFHDPSARLARSEAQAAGGRARRRSVMDDIYKIGFSLYTPGGIQAAIEHIFRLQLIGAISDRQVASMVKVLRLGVANSRNVSEHGDVVGYVENFDGFIDATELIVDRLTARDHRDRADAISDATLRAALAIAATGADRIPDPAVLGPGALVELSSAAVIPGKVLPFPR